MNSPTGFATRAQLFTLQMKDRSACTALLEAQAVDTVYLVEPEKKGARGCGWTVAINAVSIADKSFAPAEVKTLCPMTAANYIWLRDIDNLAKARFGQKLSRVHHYGTYSCRNIAGTDRLSEHAFANAWDVAAFELADGTMINVKRDWPKTAEKDGGDKAAFLREARDAACKVYRATLSPDYNAAHADHFHLDMGPYRSCR